MMTKTKKLWVCGVVVVVVAAVVTWSCWTEYGKGYSEDQRRNWNEMASWGNGRDYGNKESFLTSSLKHCQSQSDAPVWKLEIPEVSISRLPLEGMRVPVLKHLASCGDGRACLELVFRAFEDDYSYDGEEGFCFPNFSSVYQAETYGKRAEEMGTPGAGFLFRLIQARKQNVGDPDVSSLDGYDAFLSLLDQGDFLLGKIYLYLDPHGEEALSRLETGLRRKAEQGDVSALRNLAHLQLLNQIKCRLDNGITYALYRQSEKSADALHGKVEKGITWVYGILPDWQGKIKKWDQSLIEWLVSREWEETRRMLKEPVAILGKAAEGGDLHAKYLWCMYKTIGQQTFSRKEWENLLRYVDEILKAGGIYQGGRYPSCYNQIEYFYQRDSIWNVRKLLWERDKKEAGFLWPGILPNDGAIKWSAMESTKDFARTRYIGEIAQKYGFNLIAQAAEEGDPDALYYMSQMLNEGFLGKMDGKRAWDFLQKLKIWRNGINGKLGSVSLGMDRRKNRENFFYLRTFSESVDIQELDIVSRHGDMPGMTVQEAFEKFLALHSYPPFEEMLQPSRVKEQLEKKGFKMPDEKK